MSLAWLRRQVGTVPLAALQGIATANFIYGAPDGCDDVGIGSAERPFASVTKCLAEATATRNTVILMPGTYTETTGMTWPLISGISVIGFGSRWQTVIEADAGDQVIDVTPGVQASTFELSLQNVQISHGSGQDGLLLDNTAMTKKLNCYLGHVGFDGSSSDKGIITNQGDTNNAIRIYWDGQNGDVESDIYLDAGNDGNRFYAENVCFAAGLETAADAIEFQIQLRYCGVLHEGVTGGNAAQHFTAVGCFSKTGDTFAALDTNDLAGSHTESIVSV